MRDEPWLGCGERAWGQTKVQFVASMCPL